MNDSDSTKPTPTSNPEQSEKGRMARIPLPSPEEMTPEQQRIYAAVVAGPRGQVIGPLRAAIHSPQLAERWSELGEFLRYGMSIPARQTELAIIVTGRRWTSQIEWWVHARAAIDASLAPAVVEAIRNCAAPRFDCSDDAAVYEFTRQLQQTGQPDLKTYGAIHERWGVRGVVELTALIGYYTMVAMTLSAHDIPLPEGIESPLASPPNGGLIDLPPALVVPATAGADV